MFVGTSATNNDWYSISNLSPLFSFRPASFAVRARMHRNFLVFSLLLRHSIHLFTEESTFNLVQIMPVDVPYLVCAHWKYTSFAAPVICQYAKISDQHTAWIMALPISSLVNECSSVNKIPFWRGLLLRLSMLGFLMSRTVNISLDVKLICEVTATSPRNVRLINCFIIGTSSDQIRIHTHFRF